MIPWKEQLLYSVTRIVATSNEGAVSSGSGVFCEFGDLVFGRPSRVIITNRHVVDGAEEVSFRVNVSDAEGNPQIGQFHEFRVKAAEACVAHPDESVDLCMIPVEHLLAGIQTVANGFTKHGLATREVLDDVGPLEQVFMIGYPLGLSDEMNNMPIFRTGMTATSPSIDYEGRPEFLVDMPCFPGSSGSPILLGPAGRMIGILYAGAQYTANGRIEIVNLPTAMVPIARTPIPTNLGFAIKSFRILEFEPLIA